MPFLRNDAKNCITIGLSEGSMCDNCKFFQLRLNGMSGRKPGKTKEPNCDMIWAQKKATFEGRLLLQERAKEELNQIKISGKEVRGNEPTIRAPQSSRHKQFKLINKGETYSPSPITRIVLTDSEMVEADLPDPIPDFPLSPRSP